jgi:alkyl hydroperoxide reductase subunit AhpF
MNVQAVSSQLANPVTIFVNQGGGDEDPFEANLFNIARQISGVSMNRIKIEEGEDSLLPGKPSLTPSVGPTRNIHYFAAPEGTELAPFLDLLLWMGGDNELPQSDSSKAIGKLATPYHIMVLIAPTCPHCPQVVRAALSLAVRTPSITISIVDALRFDDLAQRYKVKSTPTTIINDGFTSIGRITEDELAGLLLTLDENNSLTPILESMIKAGRAEDAAALLCARKQPQAVLPIYLSNEFSVRMGALVALEEALERNPKILDPIVEDLTPLLFQEEVGLRGDTAELLGKIGNPAAIPALRKAAEDPDPDVREAAEESLQLLEN